MIKNQFGCIKNLRSNNARDYFNQTISSFLQKEGIVHYSSCVDTQQQDGVIERKNKHYLRLHKPFCFNHMFLNLIGDEVGLEALEAWLKW